MRITLGKYYRADSLIHNFDPRLKIVTSFVLMILIFCLQSLWALAAYALILLALFACAKLPWSCFWQSLKQIVAISAVIFLMNLFIGTGETVLWRWRFIVIYQENLLQAVKMLLRIVYLVLTSTLFLTLTTSPLVIAAALEDLFKPFSKLGFPGHEIAMMLSIALRFVPTIAEEMETLEKAQLARGADFDTGGIIKKAKGMVVILVPLFVSAINRALDLATSMEARCYHGGEHRTRLQQFKLQARDYLLASSLIGALVLLLLGQVYL